MREAGEYSGAAHEYDDLIAYLEKERLENPSPDLDKEVRSMALNYAVFLNRHLRDYQKALAQADLGMRCSPTPYGVSVGTAARGEALMGMGEIEQASTAFATAVEAHPINAAINSAECLVRVGDARQMEMAASLLQQVEDRYANQLTDTWRSEIEVIRRGISIRATKP